MQVELITCGSILLKLILCVYVIFVVCSHCWFDVLLCK